MKKNDEQITSIYGIKIGDSNLGKVIQESDAHDGLQEEFNKSLDTYKYERILSTDDSLKIIANGAMLFRFQVEVIEALSLNKSLSEENKQEIITNLFLDNEVYQNLYNQYYEEKDGLIVRAQRLLAVDGTKSLFDGLLPIALNPSTDISLNGRDIKNLFENLNQFKTSLCGDKTEASDKIPHTIKLNRKFNDEKNTAASIIGLVQSDPKILGSIFAVMGDKENKGEINITYSKKIKIGKQTVKGIGHSGLRCLLVAGLLFSSFATGYLAGKVLVGFMAITTMATAMPLLVAAILCAIATSKGIKYIRETVKTEATKQLSYLQTGKVGDLNISPSIISKYLLNPIDKGLNKDRETTMNSEIELRMNRCHSNICTNRELINSTIFGNKKSDLKELGRDKKLEVLLKQFGINSQGRNK